MDELIKILHDKGCACVVDNGKRRVECYGRGVKDLFDLLNADAPVLHGAAVADKVVGKGAAALMILGGVKDVYADVISEPALTLFDNEPVTVTYGKRVANIVNRLGTGICPVENLCRDCTTAADCYPLIEQFINNLK